jgi:hypothetical protein
LCAVNCFLFVVVPVAVAIMTPVPLLLMYIYNKCSARWSKKKGEALNNEDDDRIDSAESTITTEPFTIGSGNLK